MIGISTSIGSSSEGITLSFLKAKPFTISLSDKCHRATTYRPLFELLADFALILRDSGQSTSPASQVISGRSKAWWD